jgi:hypothetical protein
MTPASTSWINLPSRGRFSYDDKRTQNCDEEPRGPKPPEDLQRGVDRVLEGRPRQRQRLIGNHSGTQQSNTQSEQKDHPHYGAAEPVPAEQIVRQ